MTQHLCSFTFGTVKIATLVDIKFSFIPVHFPLRGAASCRCESFNRGICQALLQQQASALEKGGRFTLHEISLSSKQEATWETGVSPGSKQ